MIFEEDSTYDNVKEFVEETEEIYKDIDDGLINGLSAILTHANQVLKKNSPLLINTSQHEFMEKVSKHIEKKILLQDEELSKEKVLEEIEDFYRTLSPMLGEITHNLIRELNISYDKSISNSNLCVFYLRGYFYSIIEGVHEIAHRYIEAYLKEKNIKKEVDYREISGGDICIHLNSMIYELIFKEMPSTFAELSCNDYIKQKYHIDGYAPMLQLRTASLQVIDRPVFKKNNLSTLDMLKHFSEYLSFIRSNQLNGDTFNQYVQIIKQLDENCLCDYYIFKKALFESPFEKEKYRRRNLFLGSLPDYIDPHDICFLLSNYLYQNLDMNNQNKKSKIFETLLKINSLKTEKLEQERMEAILESGLPFIMKDGRLSMDSEGIRKINDAFDKMYAKYGLMPSGKEFESNQIIEKKDEANKGKEEER